MVRGGEARKMHTPRAASDFKRKKTELPLGGIQTRDIPHSRWVFYQLSYRGSSAG